MTFTATTLPAERVETIRDLGSRDSAYLCIPEFPTEVYRDMRLVARIESDYNESDIFSLFLSPENASEKRNIWESAKSEAEALFAEAHKIVELRREHDRKMMMLRNNRLDEIKALFPPNVQELAGASLPSYFITGFTNGMGSAGSAVLTAQPYMTRHETSTRLAYVISYSDGSLTRDSNTYYDSQDVALKEFVDGRSFATAAYLLEQEEEQASMNGITLPWKEPFVPENYL